MLALMGMSVSGFSGCDEEEAGVAAKDFTREELDARCDFLVRCGYMPSGDICRQSWGRDPQAVQAIGVLGFDRTEYDEQAAKAYFDLLATAECDLGEVQARELEEAKDSIFEGAVKEGDPCFADWECSGDAVCDRQDCPGNQLCCQGRCVATRELPVGRECPLPNNPEWLHTRCESTAWCQPPQDWMGEEPPLTGSCAPRVDNGMPCTDSDECLEDQRCDIGGMNTCFKLSLSGESCNPMLSEGSCLGLDQVCSPTESRCVTLPDPGQPCMQGRCIHYAQCVEEVCVARPALGEPCEGTPPCLGRLQCQDGVCQASSVSLVCVTGEDPPPPEME